MYFIFIQGEIHGLPIFKSEIKFSVETRKFIKSMQFRLETYKNDRNKNDIKNRKVFFTKMLSNTNIGIEFYKPC